MKTSLKKLRGFAQLHHQFKHDRKDNKIQPLAQLDELDKASQDLQEMRDCYDSLLSAAAAAANSAYEFSESFREMGSCLLQKIELNEDEETGKVLLMLGKSQFELQRLVDNYRSHIFHTITVPSESLLNELRTVEEMKLQCDEKRELYDYMKTKHKEKGKSRGSKGDTFSTQQLQAAKDEFDEEATLFVFRLKSLRQGQSRSLLTQAARHHAAQICFIRKALKSLEAVEPHVKSVTEQQHIDYHFTGLEDDDESEEDGEDEENDADDSGSDGSSEDSEPPSFDRRHNAFFNSLLSASRRSMDVDLDMIYPPLARMDGLKEDVDSSYDYMRERQKLTQSAPLLAPRQFDPLERIRQLRPSATKKFHSYVLPTPGNAKSPNKTITTTMKTSPVQTPKGFYHSAPLEPKKHETQLTDLGTTKNSPEPANILNTLSILKENINSRTPSPLGDKPPTSPMFPHASSEPNKKVKRHSLSGSMTNKPMVTNTRSLYAAADPPQFSPGPILRTPMPKSASTPRINSHSLRISELHELPRPPPIHLGRNLPASPHGLVGYSAPLLSRSPENSTPRANLSVNKVGASPLPTPPAIHNLYPTTGSGSPRSSSRVFEPADELEKGEDNYGASPPPPINRRELPSRRST